MEASKNTLQSEIEELIEDADEPMIAEDIIHLVHLNRSVLETRNNYPTSHYLTTLNYEPYKSGKRFSINGERTAIWVHRDNFDADLGDPDEVLRDISE